MPIIKVHLFKGHSRGVKTRLANMLTDAFRMVIPTSPNAITVLLEEFDRENYMRGGAIRRRQDAYADPVTVLSAYIKAFQTSDFDALKDCLTDDFTFTMPGGAVFGEMSEVLEWLGTQLPSFKVSDQVSETAFGERGPVVYVRGVLAGKRSDGAQFENTRMVTRYEFAGGKIASVGFWYDLPSPAPET